MKKEYKELGFGVYGEKFFLSLFMETCHSSRVFGTRSSRTFVATIVFFHLDLVFLRNIKENLNPLKVIYAYPIDCC